MFNTGYRALAGTTVENTIVIEKTLKFINNLGKTLGIRWDYTFACFDSDFYWRKEVYPEYKKNRSEVDTKGMASSFMNQMYFLYDVMNNLGFTSLRFNGFEADDIIADVCNKFPDDFKVIISTDEDLYQLLTENTVIYSGTKHHDKRMTKQLFETKYGIEPKDWVMVKAIAGCYSDNIAGITSVGEKTAIAYLKQETSETINTKIKSQNYIVSKNLKLVQLPYQDIEHHIPTYLIHNFNINTEYLDNLAKTLGCYFDLSEWEMTWNQQALFNLFS